MSKYATELTGGLQSSRHAPRAVTEVVKNKAIWKVQPRHTECACYIAGNAKSDIMNSGPPVDERGAKAVKATTMQFPERPGWLQDVNSMLVSATCHLAILIVLGLMTVAGTGSGHGESLIMNLGGSGGDAGAPDDGPVADGAALVDSSAADAATEDLAAVMGPANDLEVPAPLTSEFAPPDLFTIASPELGGDGGISLEGALDGIGGAENLRAEELAAKVGAVAGMATAFPRRRRPNSSASAATARRSCTWSMRRTA